MKIFKLVPACKDYLWGGTKLKEKYGKKSNTEIIAETWELSYHKDGKTTDEAGAALETILSNTEIGKNSTDFPFFPVLIKLIDAKQDLSVQVHPSDDYALKKENSFGKTEMWYIVEAEQGAGIYLGFKEDVTQEEYKNAIKNNTLTDLLNFFEVKPGDCFFIPSGTIHAIGKGCLICEIQQNSNLTYRVYDYGRRDKNGKTRELHIDKALEVTSLKKYVRKESDNCTSQCVPLGYSKYFTAKKLTVEGDMQIKLDSNSFRAFTCVSGKGCLDNKEINAGDTYFVSACNKEIKIEGRLEIIMTEIRKYYLGIDLGGTFIKGGIVDDLGQIVCQDKIPTEADGGDDKVAENIAKLVKILIDKLGLTAGDIEGIGMGVPGMIDSVTGTVVYSNNLHWRDYPIAEKVSRLTGISVKIANDANVAVLGEAKFGAAKGKQNVIMLTLGTGVGGGIIANGALVEGNRSVGAELGHVVITIGGEKCSCGRHGCLEAYASATALIRDTKRAMEAHKDTKMWEIGSLDKVTGKTAFDYADTDKFAKEIIDNYIYALACGIVNYCNIFRPEVVLLGGGVCAQGDSLMIPLKKLVNEEIYGGSLGPEVEIKVATLENSAGILGAASLIM